VSWLDLSLTDLGRAAAADEPIIEQWRANGIRLMGTDLDQLLRETS